jgi:hypothetical protein
MDEVGLLLENKWRGVYEGAFGVPSRVLGRLVAQGVYISISGDGVSITNDSNIQMICLPSPCRHL